MPEVALQLCFQACRHRSVSVQINSCLLRGRIEPFAFPYQLKRFLQVSDGGREPRNFLVLRNLDTELEAKSADSATLYSGLRKVHGNNLPYRLVQAGPPTDASPGVPNEGFCGIYSCSDVPDFLHCCCCAANTTLGVSYYATEQRVQDPFLRGK